MYKKKAIAKRAYVIGTSFLAILLLVLFGKVTVNASSVVMPISPYIPPTTVAIYDIINTVFGVTSPDIQDDYERLQAYARLYESALGESWDSFQENIDEIQQTAAITNQISINSNMFDSVQTALTQALTQGYYYGTQYDVADTPQEWKEALTDRYGIECSMTILENLYSNRSFGTQVKQPSVLIFAIYDNGTKIMFNTVPYEVYWPVRYQIHTNGYYYPMYNGSIQSGNYIVANYQNGQVGSVIYDSYGGRGINGITLQGNTYSSAGDNAQVVAQTSAIETAIQSHDVVPVTADTESVGGSIVINLPNINVYPATDISDLEDQQETLGVTPTTPGMTAEQIQDIVDALKEAQTLKYGTTKDYQLYLTEYFPFCIPFDVGNLLMLFVAEPQAPVIEFSFPTGYDVETGFTFTQFEMDLSQFDTVALWCRRGMMLLFIVGLGFITRSIVLRG